MPPLVVPFVVEVTWSGTYGPRPWANVQHFVLDDSNPTNRANALSGIASKCEDAWNDQLASRLSDEMSLTNVRVQDLDSLSGEIVNLTSTFTGGQSGASLPPSVAVLVTKQSSHNRTQRNGRWFQSGILEGDTDNPAMGTLNAAGLTAWTNAFNLFAADIDNAVGGIPNYPVVLHKSSTAPSGYTVSTMTGYVPAALLATQRRRQRK